jgi:hypothetical protein
VNKPIRLLGLRHVSMWKTEPTDENPLLLLFKLTPISNRGTVGAEWDPLCEAVINLRSRHDMEASWWSDVKFPRPMDILPGSWHVIVLYFDCDNSRSVLYVSPDLHQ